ncbi:MAG: lipid A deacylase LpxR family protein [Epsilonproteobacteria bacterium]|nr:lipid A deacylase LpxR family protein [Campylobacterota bacterium]
MRYIILIAIVMSVFAKANSAIWSFDDDALASRDDYHYTGGMYFGYMFDENRSLYNPNILKGYSNSNALSLTYMVFTPQNKRSTTPVLDDIPYAGYAKAEFSIYKYNKNEFFKLGVNISAVGEMVKAKQIQSNFHHLIGHSVPKGWDTQLGNRVFCGISAGYAKKTDILYLKDLKYDWTNFIKVDAGGYYSSIYFSTAIRFGGYLPDTFETIPDMSGVSSDELLHFQTIKKTAWNVSIGAFVNKIGNFYIIDEAIDEGYELSSIDYIYGVQISFDFYYRGIKYNFKIKSSKIQNKNSSPFNDEQWGSFSVTWKF